MKRVLVGMLAGLLAMPYAASAQSPQPSPPAAVPAASNAVQATLSNGMRVILLPNKLAPVVTTMIAYRVGSDDDTMPGIAHATEHMLFRGTANLSGGQLADVAARMGADYNAFTGEQFTLYYYKIPSAYADLRCESKRTA